MQIKNKKLLFVIIILIIFCLIPSYVCAKKDIIYLEPSIKDSSNAQDKGLDDMINDAEEFEEKSEEAENTGILRLDTGELQTFSNSLYSVLLIAATAVTVLIGIVIGIKYVTGSVEEKAEYKKLLFPYVIGCVIIYGSFGIWKLVVEILEAV